MSADEVETALANLQSIKQGQNPHARDDTASTGASLTPPQDTDEQILSEFETEVYDTFKEHPFLADHLSPDQLTIVLADWERRRGVCKYNRRSTKRVYGKRMASTHLSRQRRCHIVGVARRVYKQGNNWRGTLRHEVAHAYLYNKHDESQKHNRNFKRVNQRIGGSPAGGTNDKKYNYKYALACPECGWKNGYRRRTKKIKKPWNRFCTECGTACVSHDWDDAMPDEPGTCAIESIGWETSNEYYAQH